MRFRDTMHFASASHTLSGILNLQYPVSGTLFDGLLDHSPLHRPPPLDYSLTHLSLARCRLPSYPAHFFPMKETKSLVRKLGVLVVKLDAFGLCLGRLMSDQWSQSTECRLERFEYRQDEEYNVIYYKEGIWVEKDLEQLMDVPEYLFEHVAEEDCYLAKGSLVEYFIEQNSNLDRDVVNFLKSEDKWKYKVSYEYRQRAKRKRELAAYKKRITRIDLTRDDEEVEEEIQEVDEDDAQKDQVSDKMALVKGAYVVFERHPEEILYGQVGWTESTVSYLITNFLDNLGVQCI